jgi:NAD(P)-dependent dehydrogenase (short-subunit alcohol dehydrogenase family)
MGTADSDTARRGPAMPEWVGDYTPAADLLAERVILITGAAEGIGRVAARACAAHGATVVLLDKTVPRLEALYDEIEQAGHPQPAIYPMDLEGAQPHHYQELAGSVQERLGRLDGLVHNAAVLGTLGPLHHVGLETWSTVMQVNLHAPFLLTHACLPLLQAAPDASIVFLSDRVGRRGRAYWGAYGVSKFGIEGLMQILADEWEYRPSLRFNSLDPGPVATQLRYQAYPAEDPAVRAAPESVVPALLYLLGPDSRGVTGRAFYTRAPGQA